MAKKPKTPAPEVPAVSEQPYYLQRAHIKDFRSIRDAKVEFKPGLNIIIGPNGSGKTNFVRVVGEGLRGDFTNVKEGVTLGLSGRLALEMQSMKIERNMPNFPFITGSTYYVMNFLSSGQEIQTAIVPLGVIKIAERLGAKADYFFDTLVIDYDVPARYPIVRTPESFSLDGIEQIFDDSFSGKLSNSMLWQIKEYAEVRVDSVKNELAAIKSYIRKIALVHIDAIKNEMQRFTPIDDMRLSRTIQVYHNSTQKEYIVNGLFFEFKVGDDWLPFNSLSSGTQRLFYIVSEIRLFEVDDLRISRPVKDKYYKSQIDKIILLEEPELGIHPDQLYKLLQFLREQSEKHQLIITTHSPQVLDMLRDDELDRITICELDEKKGTQFRKLTKKKIATAQKFMKEVGYLSDYWLYSSLEEKSPYKS